MRFAAFCLMVLLGLVLGPVPNLVPAARAGVVDALCNNQDANPPLRIGACAVEIVSGKWTGKNLAPAYFNRGVAYLKLGKYARAIEDFDRAVKLDPEFALAYSNRGGVYIELGKYTRAIEDLDQAIRIDPELANAYVNRGGAYLGLGEYARAIEDLDRAVRIDPEDTSAWHNRGGAYLGLGEHARAIEDYDQAIRLNPESFRFYHNRGAAYRGLGEFDRAIRDWEQSIEIGGIPRVRVWQDSLKKIGHYSGAVDGVYDPETKAALIACVRDPEC